MTKKRDREDVTLEADYEAVSSKVSRFHEEVQEEVDQCSKARTEAITNKDIKSIINLCFGTLYNLFVYCGGPGTYMIIGPTESGKTTLIRSLYMTAQLFSVDYGYPVLLWRTLLVFSSTEEFTQEFSWAGDIVHYLPLDVENLKSAVEARKKEMEIGAAALSEETGTEVTAEEWALSNPIGMVLDDWSGIIDASHHGNYLTYLTTVARKMGIFLMPIAHGENQCSPTMKRQSRAILTLKFDYDNHKKLSKTIHGTNSHNAIAAATSWSKKAFHVVVYVRQWLLSRSEFKGIPAKVLLLPPFPRYPRRRPIRFQEYQALLDDYEKGARSLEEYLNDDGTSEFPEEDVNTIINAPSLSLLKKELHPDNLTRVKEESDDGELEE